MITTLQGVFAALVVCFSAPALQDASSLAAFLESFAQLMAEDPESIIELVESALDPTNDGPAPDPTGAPIVEPLPDGMPGILSGPAVRRPIVTIVPGGGLGGGSGGGGGGGGGGGPPGGGGPVDAIITPLDLSGMAPFTVHAHALDSTLGAGDKRTAWYEWDFGDPGSPYNQLEGWNVAHTYDQPGTYTITLTLTDEAGGSDQASVTVNVEPDTRTTLYVAANGNDSNSGLSEGEAIRTIGRVSDLLGDNMTVRFRRGNTFDTAEQWRINDSNVVVDAYGTGAPPVLRWTGAAMADLSLIELDEPLTDLVIQNLVFSNLLPASPDNAHAIGDEGSNVTVRNCHFERCSDALKIEHYPTGWFVVDNTSAVIGAKFAWCTGTDFVLLGNEAEGSLASHIIRSGGIDRVLVAQNVLTGYSQKTAIWIQRGSHAWVADNTTFVSVVALGPNWADGADGLTLEYVRVENNDVHNNRIKAEYGTQQVIIRDNIIWNASVGIEISGYYEPRDRHTKDVIVASNTIVHDGDSSRGIQYAADIEDGLLVENNLFYAPDLQTGDSGAATWTDQGSAGLPANYLYRDNLWPVPVSGAGPHYVNGYISDFDWGMLPMTSGEQYRPFVPGDLDLLGNPTFPTTAGARR